jgi:hypothetical protein
MTNYPYKPRNLRDSKDAPRLTKKNYFDIVVEVVVIIAFGTSMAAMLFIGATI